MAMLEVHDGRGRVDYVTITCDHPALFGSDPQCDIVLSGAGVVPFHGRFRWKETKYKVEATPEGRAVTHNGRKVVAASFREGDEIQVGPCRIFMTEGEAAPDAAEAATRVQPRPAPSSKPSPTAAAPRRERTKAAPAAEAAGWIGMEVAPPSAETAVAEGEPARRRGRDRAAEAAPAEPAAGPKTSRIKRAFQTFLAGEQAPGQEKIATSPLVVFLAIVLIGLGSLSFLLYRVIARTMKDRAYLEAADLFEGADYRNAVPVFDKFIEAYPKDPRLPKAKALRAMSRVKQFAVGPGASWSTTVEEARHMVEEVGNTQEYGDQKHELAEYVLKAAENLADRAKSAAEARDLTTAEKILTETKGAERLHDQILGDKLAVTFKEKSRFPEKYSTAYAAVGKARIRAQALAAMDKALKENSAAAVYDARDRLVDQFPDLVKDKQVVEKLTAANELLRKAVVFDPSQRPGETEPHRELLAPPVTLVLRDRAPGGTAAGGGGPVVYALADGFATGLDGNSGDPLWQAPVGLSSPYTPVAVPGVDPAALVFDARHNELVRLDGRTGKLVWRQMLGERVNAPPLVIGNQVVQATPGGKLLLIGLSDGALQGTLDTHRALTGTPVSDEAGTFFYVTADEANLFVVQREPLGCAGVEYLGHAAGSVPCAPVRIDRYLFVTENHGLNESRWTVFLTEQDGPKVRRVQQLTLPGWQWSPPAAMGSVIWFTGDRGGLSAYAIGPPQDKEPIKRIASKTAEAVPTGPAYARLKSERELWLSSSLSARYDLNTDSAAIRPAWTFQAAGPALAPVQATDRLEILTQQYTEGQGVALWGIDPNTGAPAWRTVLGASWTVAPDATPGADSVNTLDIAGKPLTVSRETLRAGGFVEQTIPRPGAFRLPAGPLPRVEVGGLTVLVPAPGATALMVREGTGGGDGDFRRVDLPAAIDGTPVVVGGALLVPAAGGRAYLIDPKTGESKAEPYLAGFDRYHPTRWFAPALLKDEKDDAVVLADQTGKVRRLSIRTDPKPRLVATNEVNLGSPIIADPASTGGAVVVATADHKIRPLAGRDLSPTAGTVTLEAPIVFGPVAAGDHAFVADASGYFMAFGPDGRRLWSAQLDGPPPVGRPVVRDGAVLFLDRSGALHRLALADGSNQEDPVPLGVRPAGGLRLIGDDVVVPVAPGALRTLSAGGK